MVNQEEISALIIKTLTDLIDTFPESERFTPTSETVLFGQGSVIDSLTLVSFIVDLEAMLSEKYNQEISLTDDRAMTREKSPFSSVSSLAEYIQEII
jgi:acyl carrier protein